MPRILQEFQYRRGERGRQNARTMGKGRAGDQPSTIVPALSLTSKNALIREVCRQQRGQGESFVQAAGTPQRVRKLYKRTMPNRRLHPKPLFRRQNSFRAQLVLLVLHDYDCG
jgi:hypothetical protein